MPLNSGTKVGSYEILSALGAGGMGEVYLARDTRLGRNVAIKVLPESFQQDEERLLRFQREAQLLASVNHANIAAIHGLEESNGAVHLVLELVPGETLAQKLLRGRLPIEEALGICRQVAEALEAAHEKGIIHRDLKPANIKVTPEGQVKVLDFGLAKSAVAVAGTSSRSDSDSPTASLGGTSAGLILGTASYMSPEQARGKPVDKRTDVWSFGCVLYETLTSRRAFAGETATDTVAAIIEREPEWSALPPHTPDGIRRLLRRCLQKDRKRRMHDIADARIEIEEALTQPDVTAAGKPEAAALGKSMLLAGVVGLALGAAVALWVSGGGVKSAEAPRISQVARLTHDPGLSEWPTWSPDGKLLAFASDRSGNFEIYVRRIEGGHEVNVTNDPGQDYQPAFSPDGQWIAFISTRTSRTGMIKIGATFGMEFRTFGGDLWVAPALGGGARRLATDANFPVWHPDGKRIAYVTGTEGHRAILEIPAAGGDPKPLLAGNDSRWEAVKIQYSPDGRWLSLGTVDPEKILLLSLPAGGEPKELLDASTHVWDPTGERLYYLKREALGGTRLESVRIGAAGNLAAPETIGVMTGILRDMSISADGRSLSVSEIEGSMNLTLQPLQPGGGAPAGPEEQLTSGQAIDRYPVFSPDGKRIAYASNRLGPQEIWILEVATRQLRKLPVPEGYLNVSLPYWSPDGHKIAMAPISADGKRSLWLVAVDGSEATELVPPTKDLGSSRFSRDGRKLLFSGPSGEHLQVFEVDLATRQTQQITFSPSDKWPEEWSSDGRWLLYTSTADGTTQVWRMLAEGGKEEQLTFGHERVRHASYSPDGKWIYVQPSHRNIYRIPANGGAMQPVTKFPESRLFLEEPTISPDGRSLLYCRSNGGSSLWLITLEAAAGK